MRQHRLLRTTFFLLLCLLLGAVPVSAQRPAPHGQALIYVPIPTADDLARFRQTGLPAYARLQGIEGGYLLAGGDAADLARLAGAGLRGQVLDDDTAGTTYYLAHPPAGRDHPAWSDYGRVLWDDGRRVLLAATAKDAARLSQAGAEIVLLNLTPKPLQPVATTSFPAVTAADPLIQGMIDQVSQAAVRQDIGDLSGEWPVTVRGTSYTIATRNTFSDTPIEKATQFVGDHLQSLGLAVEYHRWGPATAPNVVAELAGQTHPDDIFMITAHLDDMPTDATAPGADDNASGSAAVLVAADILSQYPWGCTLRFALWTGEEQGLLGSSKYAQRSSNNAENIAGVLNLDMIAWNTAGSTPDIDLHADSALPATLDLANLFADVVDVYGLNLLPEVIPDGTTASDHASFWDYGYTAILGIEDYYPGEHDFNPRYHTTGDRLEYLDMAYATDFVKASVAALAHMSGCLLTGTLDGHVTAAHDGSPIEGASLTMTDGHGHSYAATAESDGYYAARLPAGTYTVTATAYGYLQGEAGGVGVNASATASRDFVLQAAAPAAPDVTIRSAGGAQLTWTHVPPDMTYQVHRATGPYFNPGPTTRLETLGLPFDDPVTYTDTTAGIGNANTNHFYTVLGMNAAAQGAASNRVGEFDFALVAGR